MLFREKTVGIKGARIWLAVPFFGMLLSFSPLVVPACKIHIAIDSCLDAGGCWDYSRNDCVTAETENQSCAGGKDSPRTWILCLFIPTCVFLISVCGLVASVIFTFILVLLKLRRIGLKRVYPK